MATGVLNGHASFSNFLLIGIVIFTVKSLNASTNGSFFFKGLVMLQS